MSWHDYFNVHRAAKLFPPVSPEQLTELAEDIRANGLQQRVVLFYDGEEPSLTIRSKPDWWRAKTHFRKISVGDGINRLDAMERHLEYDWSTEGSAHFKVVYLKGGDKEDVDPFAFAVSANLKRRHLDSEQKRELIATLRKAQPAKSDNAIAKEVGASPTTVGKVTAELEARGEVSKMETRIGRDGKSQAARKCATAKAKAIIEQAIATRVEQAISEQATAAALDDSKPSGEPIKLEAEPPPRWTPKAPELFEAVLRMLDEHSEAAHAAQVRTRAEFARKVLLALDVTLEDLKTEPAEA